jgi:hypothetical protein
LGGFRRPRQNDWSEDWRRRLRHAIADDVPSLPCIAVVGAMARLMDVCDEVDDELERLEPLRRRRGGISEHGGQSTNTLHG